MPQLFVFDAAQLATTCEQNLSDIGASFSQAFGLTLTAAAVQTGELANASEIESLSGPGLAISFAAGDALGALFVPAATGLLPEWYASGTVTEVGKLATLAQELAMLLLSEVTDAQSSQAEHVDDFAAALVAGGFKAGGRVTFSLTHEDGRTADVTLVGPLDSLSAFWGHDADADSTPVASESTPQEVTEDATPSPDTVAHLGGEPLSALPAYTRSLLRIKVPVSVTLACKKQPISRILELGCGAILQFDKSCDEPLDLEVNGHVIAEGETVKVGEKFGIRIISLTLPDEQFLPVRPARVG